MALSLLYIAFKSFSRVHFFYVRAFLVLFPILYYSWYLRILVLFWLLSSARFAVIFTNFSFLSHPSPAYSNIGMIDHIHKNTYVSSGAKVPVCKDRMHLAYFSLTLSYCFFYVFASQEQSIEVFTSKYVYWSTIGNSCCPYFQLEEDTGLILVSLHTTTAHVLTFAVTVCLLVYSSAFSICFINPSGVADIPTR